jgi:dihydroneopterin aldolase / 2-amino-4-hydroxy-6-hydroxymethyldihydropteridine diphosphokinase
MSHTAFIAIGSNLGTPKENCIEAINIISSNPDIKIISKSSFYQTAPVGNTEQDWFINSVIKISTRLNSDILLSVLLEIESNMGRIRKEKWGPRTIDLDLLFYDNLIAQQKDLTLPHPEIQKRNFVLQPLNEIEENFIHPSLKKSINTLLKESKDDSVIKKLN